MRHMPSCCLAMLHACYLHAAPRAAGLPAYLLCLHSLQAHRSLPLWPHCQHLLLYRCNMYLACNVSPFARCCTMAAFHCFACLASTWPEHHGKAGTAPQRHNACGFHYWVGPLKHLHLNTITALGLWRRSPFLIDSAGLNVPSHYPHSHPLWSHSYTLLENTPYIIMPY